MIRGKQTVVQGKLTDLSIEDLSDEAVYPRVNINVLSSLSIFLLLRKIIKYLI